MTVDESQAISIINRLKAELSKTIVGQQELIEGMLISLMVQGHILLEGVPGVAKTLAANSLAKAVACQFKRVQFTPDMLPADLIGTNIFDAHKNNFYVRKGPIFTNFLLADEINRAPSKVQSALLEVMQESQVTIDGQSYKLESPFLVIATQNPLEQEGTYPLSEAQTDRFLMKIVVSYPSQAEEKQILRLQDKLSQTESIKPVITATDLFMLQEVCQKQFIDDKIIDYLLELVAATRYPKKYSLSEDNLIDFGVSPRASIALKNASKARALIEGRNYVTPDDVRNVLKPILRHRLKISYEAEASEIDADKVIDLIINKVSSP